MLLLQMLSSIAMRAQSAFLQIARRLYVLENRNRINACQDVFWASDTSCFRK
jgi:hypothetical protein